MCSYPLRGSVDLLTALLEHLTALIFSKLSFLHVIEHQEEFVGPACALLAATYFGYGINYLLLLVPDHKSHNKLV